MSIRVVLEFRDAAQLADLALFLKRVHFGDWLGKTDACWNPEQRKEQAYRFGDAQSVIETALEVARGLRPR